MADLDLHEFSKLALTVGLLLLIQAGFININNGGVFVEEPFSSNDFAREQHCPNPGLLLVYDRAIY